jgi:hypothetical protein
MITKQQFTDAVLFEIGIIKHLFTKIPANGFDYKPTEKQRTTMELLQYLAGTGAASVKAIHAGDKNVYMEERKKTDTITPDQFLAAMDQQAEIIKQVMNEMTDEELAMPLDLWGMGMAYPKALVLLQMVLESFVAYKMQLFLYIKSSGNTDIGTSNLWQGRDGSM